MGILPFRIPAPGSIPNWFLSICGAEANGLILKSDQSGRIYLLPRRGRPSGVRLVSVLSELKIGETGVVEALDLPESVQNHLMHMGFVPDALVAALRRAPAGDPTVYAIDGMEIALRHETASAIRVRPHVEVPARQAGVSQVKPDAAEPQGIPAPAELAEVAQ